jgi:lysyl-tRNA synthetase class 2
MMDFVEAIIRETAQGALARTSFEVAGQSVDLKEPFPRVRMVDAVSAKLGAPVSWESPFAEVRALAAGKGHVPEDLRKTDDLIVHLFEELCEGDFVRPTFVYEFPKSISPLAKSVAGRPEVADRFELYANRMEIANGYSELNDPREQYERFMEQVERRKGGDMEAVGQIDEDYVRALEYGMVPTAGLGIGIDRLVMLLTGAASIRDVILFPLMKPRAEVPEMPGEESEA